MLFVDADSQGDLAKSLGWRDLDSLETTLAIRLSAKEAPAAGKSAFSYDSDGKVVASSSRLAEKDGGAAGGGCVVRIAVRFA